MPPVARMLIVAGLVLIAVGVLAALLSKTGIPFGRLPGDIRVEGRHGSFYFPIVTCLVISVVLSLLMWLFRR
jgi:hypothetical protein